MHNYCLLYLPHIYTPLPINSTAPVADHEETTEDIQPSVSIGLGPLYELPDGVCANSFTPHIKLISTIYFKVTCGLLLVYNSYWLFEKGTLTFFIQ